MVGHWFVGALQRNIPVTSVMLCIYFILFYYFPFENPSIQSTNSTELKTAAFPPA